jgi:uncharacterized repeat protein (TIGR02543 family)
LKNRNVFKRVLALLTVFTMLVSLSPNPVNFGNMVFASNDIVVEGSAAIDILLNAGSEAYVLAGDLMRNNHLQNALINGFRARLTADFPHLTPEQIENMIPEINITLPMIDVTPTDLRQWHVFDHFDNLNTGINPWTAPTSHGMPVPPRQGSPNLVNLESGTNWRFLPQTATTAANIIAGNLGANHWTQQNLTFTAANQMPVMNLYDWVHRTLCCGGTVQNRHDTNAAAPVGSRSFRGRPRTHSEHVDSLGIFDRHILASYDHETGEPRIDFVGYRQFPIQDFLLFPSTAAVTKQVSFEISSAETNAHTLDGAGFLVNAGITTENRGQGMRDYLHGYLLYYVFPGMESTNAVPSHLMLYRIGRTSTAGVFTSGIAVNELRASNKSAAGGAFFTPSNPAANKHNNNLIGTLGTDGATNFAGSRGGVFTAVNVPAAAGRPAMTNFRLQTSGNNFSGAVAALIGTGAGANSVTLPGMRISNRWNNDMVFSPTTGLPAQTVNPPPTAPVTWAGGEWRNVPTLRPNGNTEQVLTWFDSQWSSEMEVYLEVSPSHIEIFQRPLGSPTPWGDATRVFRYEIPETERTNHQGFGPYVGYNLHGCVRASVFSFKNLEMSFIDQSDHIYDVLSNANFIQNSDKYFIDLVTQNTITRRLFHDGSGHPQNRPQGGPATGYMQVRNIEYITNNPHICCEPGASCNGISTLDCRRRPTNPGPDPGSEQITCCYEWNGSTWNLVCDNIVCANNPYTHQLTPQNEFTGNAEAYLNYVTNNLVNRIINQHFEKYPPDDSDFVYPRKEYRHIKGLSVPVATLQLVENTSNPGNSFIREVMRDRIGSAGFEIFGYDKDSVPSSPIGADTFGLTDFYYHITNPFGQTINRDGNITTTTLLPTSNFRYTAHFDAENQAGAQSLLRITNDRLRWSAGVYTVRLMVRDNSPTYNLSSNIAQVTFTVTEDITPPKIPVASVTNTTLSFTATDLLGDVTGSFNENYGIARYSLIFRPQPSENGISVAALQAFYPTAESVTEAGGVFTVTFATPVSESVTRNDIPLVSGNYTLRLAVYDVANNRTEVWLPRIYNDDLTGIRQGTTVAGVGIGANERMAITPPMLGTNVVYTTNNTVVVPNVSPQPNTTEITIRIPRIINLTVNVNLDNAPWNTRTVELVQNGIAIRTLTAAANANNVIFADISGGTYNIRVAGAGGSAERTFTGVPNVNYTETLNFFTVGFDLGYTGSPAPPPNQILLSGSHVNPVSEPTRTGYTFGGWYNGINEWNFTNNTVTGAANLTARWNPIMYTVTFETLGGTPVPANQTVQHGQTAARPATDPTLTGRSFVNWYTAETGGTVFNFNTPILEATTVWARWSLNNYTVTWHTNSGTPAPTQLTVSHGGSITLPAAITRTGHSFEGWYDNTAFTGTPVTFPVNNVTGNREFWARWTPHTYNVTWHTDGGSPAIAGQTTVNHGSNITAPSVVTKTGYTFAGWYDNAAFTGSPVSFAVENVTGHREFWARWTLNDYTVTWHTNGGNPAPAQTAIDHGETINEPPAMTRTGHSFGGWYTNAALTMPAVFPETNVISAREFWARWIPDTYSVTWNTNGGTPAVAGQTTVLHGESIAAPGTITKTGNTFVNWYDNAELTGTPVTFPFDNAAGNTTFWARWQPNSFTVRFYVDGVFENDVSVLYGELIPAPTILPPQNYKSDGWFLQPNFTDEWNLTNNFSSVTISNFAEVETNGFMNLYTRFVAYDFVTVEFESNGGTNVPSQRIIEGGTAARPANPVRARYTFANWYAEAALQNVWNFATPVFGNMILFARWAPAAPPEGMINIWVDDENGTPRENIRIRIEQGAVSLNPPVSGTTNENGLYTTNMLPAGAYNIVIEYTDNAGVNVIITEILVISNNATRNVNITLSAGGTFSRFEQTPGLRGNNNMVTVNAVSNLDSQFADTALVTNPMNRVADPSSDENYSPHGISDVDIELAEHGGYVQIRLTARTVYEAATDGCDVRRREQSPEQRDILAEYAATIHNLPRHLALDLRVVKYRFSNYARLLANDPDAGHYRLVELNDILTHFIQLPDIHRNGGTQGHQVFRFHIDPYDPNLSVPYMLPNGNANANQFGEYWEFDHAKNMIILNVRRFSTFLIAYRLPPSVNHTAQSITGGGILLPPIYQPEPLALPPISEDAPDETDILKLSDVSHILNTTSRYAYVHGRGGYMFRPDSSLTRAEAVQIFFNLLNNPDVSGGTVFPDVGTDKWYSEAIEAMSALNIVTGYPDGTFRPNAPITRAEFAAIAVSFAQLAPGGRTFSDILPAHWAFNHIRTAANFGWVGGFPDGTFRPDQNITRAEAVIIVNRVLRRVPDIALIRSDAPMIRYNDAPLHWAFYDIVEASNIEVERPHRYTDGVGIR